MLFTHDDQWRVHLKILFMMINDTYADVLKLVNSNDSAAIAGNEIPAFLFFCGLLIWLDLQSSVSIGQPPRLSQLHDQVSNRFPDLFRLQNIIGCESWVLRLIGRIANIQEWKVSQGMTGKMDAMELRKKSEQIRDHLYQGLERVGKELRNTSNLSNYSSLETTQIFALAAMTYLHITISGPQNDLGEMQASVHQTIHALKQLKDAGQLKVLPWPLYVTGCMAIGAHRGYILKLFGTLHILYSGACAQDRYSEMLKQYWTAREMQPDCDMWKTDFGRPLFI